MESSSELLEVLKRASNMLSELCKELNNWFNNNQPKYFGKNIRIENGRLDGFDDALQEGQYYRIIGSLFNDGVHKFGSEHLEDETFQGAVWAMAIPSEVIALAEDIEAWKEKYQSVDSPAMSPYNSESFGGYSYSKSTGGSSDGGAGTWQAVFATRLNNWRKLP